MQEAAALGLGVQVGLVGRAAAVQAVEVQARGAEVLQRIRVVQALQRRGRVEGDVVVDELAQVGVARGDGRVLVGRLGHLDRLVRRRRGLAAVLAHVVGELAGDHQAGQVLHQLLNRLFVTRAVGGECRFEPAEQTPEACAADAGLGCAFETSQRP
jgi:hypothetical protein